jgi:hypothetical protein
MAGTVTQRAGCLRTARPGSIPLLNHLIERSDYALARMHALCVLDGLGALTEDQFEKA